MSIVNLSQLLITSNLISFIKGPDHFAPLSRNQMMIFIDFDIKFVMKKFALLSGIAPPDKGEKSLTE